MIAELGIGEWGSTFELRIYFGLQVTSIADGGTALGDPEAAGAARGNPLLQRHVGPSGWKQEEMEERELMYGCSRSSRPPVDCAEAGLIGRVACSHVSTTS